jgi:hypothetical protein
MKKTFPYKRILSYYRLNYVSGRFEKAVNLVPFMRSGEHSPIDDALKTLHSITSRLRYRDEYQYLVEFRCSDKSHDLDLAIEIFPTVINGKTFRYGSGDGVMYGSNEPEPPFLILILNPDALEIFVYKNYDGMLVDRMLLIDNPYQRFKDKNWQILEEMDELRRTATHVTPTLRKKINNTQIKINF